MLYILQTNLSAASKHKRTMQFFDSFLQMSKGVKTEEGQTCYNKMNFQMSEGVKQKKIKIVLIK